jgi:hypothetical protein
VKEGGKRRQKTSFQASNLKIRNVCFAQLYNGMLQKLSAFNPITKQDYLSQFDDPF